MRTCAKCLAIRPPASLKVDDSSGGMDGRSEHTGQGTLHHVVNTGVVREGWLRPYVPTLYALEVRINFQPLNLPSDFPTHQDAYNLTVQY